MSSYRQHLYHIVFRTKHSMPTIKQDHVNELYAYITGIVKNKNGHLYRINGVENHIHVLTDMHPSIAPADFMREIKASSSLWMKNSMLFPSFIGWEEGYGSFTCSYKEGTMCQTPGWRRGLFIFGSFRANKFLNLILKSSYFNYIV